MANRHVITDEDRAKGRAKILERQANAELTGAKIIDHSVDKNGNYRPFGRLKKAVPVHEILYSLMVTRCISAESLGHLLLGHVIKNNEDELKYVNSFIYGNSKPKPEHEDKMAEYFGFPIEILLREKVDATVAARKALAQVISEGRLIRMPLKTLCSLGQITENELKKGLEKLQEAKVIDVITDPDEVLYIVIHQKEALSL